MKQRIRELLSKAPTPGGYAGQFENRESRDTRGMLNGDTYLRYSRRCELSGLEPKEFREWLAYELGMARPGRHVYLDEVQRVEAMRLQAG